MRRILYRALVGRKRSHAARIERIARAMLMGSAAVFAALVAAPRAMAQLSELDTPDLQMIYLNPSETYLVPHAARCFERSLKFHEKLFDYVPWEKQVTVLLKDLSDAGNGGATPQPRNFLNIDIAPIGLSYETYPANERMNTLMNHELVHIVAFDKAANSDITFRRIFHGKVQETPDHPETILYNYLTLPRTAAPRWFHEGLATFVETWMAGGIGRAQGSYDEMVFRSMVKDGSRFYDPLGLASEGTKVDFQLEANSYLYGTRFLSYMANRVSPESVLAWASRTPGSRASYAAQFKKVYGMPLKSAWHDWIEAEHTFQTANLEAIRKYPVTPYTDLSSRALGSVSRAYYDPATEELYTAFYTPGIVASIGAINVKTGTLRRLHEIKGPMIYGVTSIAYDPDTRTIFYTTDNYAWRDLVSLNPATGKAHRLMKDARIGELVFNRTDRSLWGVRHLNGICTLVRIPYPYKEWAQIVTFPYGTLVYDMDISPDGQFLSASIGEINGDHAVHVMRLADLLQGGGVAAHGTDSGGAPDAGANVSGGGAPDADTKGASGAVSGAGTAGKTSDVAKFDFGTTIPSNFVFSQDGRYLYGSSYYSGASNIFRYEIVKKDLQAVSNCETGMFRPVPLGGDRLVVFRYTGAGFLPAIIEAKPLEDVNAITFFGAQLVDNHPIVKEWKAPSPKDIPLDSMITYQGKYRSVKNMSFGSWYPIVEGYRGCEKGSVDADGICRRRTNAVAGGFSVDFYDSLQINHVNFTATYSPGQDLSSDEHTHLKLRYQRYNWQVDLRYNPANFYDLFGPTKVSQKGYSAGAQWSKTLVNDLPRMFDLRIGATYYGNIDRLPDYQNVDATFDKLSVAEARLTYKNLRQSIGSVDYEKGLKAEAILGFQYENGTSIPSLIGNFDFGVPLWSHNSLWLRTSAGAAHGDVDNPFANFFFGGFGNNYVDHQEAKRYREWYAFPGVDLNSIGGKTYGKAMVEWNFPPIRFSRAGTPSFYLSWLRPSLFVSGIKTNLSENEERTSPPSGPPGEDQTSLIRKVADVGGQIDLRFTALARQDLTLSTGYARSYEHGRHLDDEFMISLKILR